MEKKKFTNVEVEVVLIYDALSTSGDMSDEWDTNSVDAYPIY